MAKKTSPTYNAVGLLPEAQLRILSDAHYSGSVLPDRFEALNADEQALIDYGFLTLKEKSGLPTLCLTKEGLRVAPNVPAMTVRWEKFNEIAPYIAMSILDNVGSTIIENKLPRATDYDHAITELILCLISIDLAEDTYSDSYPEEVAAIAKAVGG